MDTQAESAPPPTLALNPDLLRRAADCLRRARRLLFITGAGISAESGLPTYRGVGGLYNGADPETGLAIEEILSAEVFARRPELTWTYLAQIERACRDARPNAAHRRIAALQNRREVVVLTQNVDSFHRDTGVQHLIEIHGNLHRLRCTGCDHRTTVADYAGLSFPPRCARCGGLIRPDVVLFGEWLPEEALMTLQQELARGFDVVVSIGTSARFPYVVAPVTEALQRGVPTIDINPERTELSALADLHLACGAVAALEAICPVDAG